MEWSDVLVVIFGGTLLFGVFPAAIGWINIEDRKAPPMTPEEKAEHDREMVTW